MPKTSLKTIVSNHDKLFKDLISWSLENFSELPWRKKRTMYRTLVSEIMLQQTTVPTVLNYFEKFLEKYPNTKSLSQTTDDEISHAWKGLGYYRRARNLRKIGLQIEKKFKGKIASNLEELISLDGIGNYTASALVAIGADQKALAVDANIERVLARFYGIKEKNMAKLKEYLRNAFENKKIISNQDQLSPRHLNESLMDLGREICQARKAQCQICPLVKGCLAFQSKTPLEYPYNKAKVVKKEFNLKLLRIIVKNKNKYLFYQKRKGEWLEGQWELPTYVIEVDDPSFKQYPFLSNNIEIKKLKKFKTNITKYKIENYILELSFKEFNKIRSKSNYVWLNHTSSLNLSTATQKTLDRFSV